jgi:hypothetical protein
MGLVYAEGAILVSAVTHRLGGDPPLFPAVLALFAAISRHPAWLRLVPLLSTAGWLALTRRLLIKMGASRESSRTIVVLTAASPTVLYLATGLFAEPLFALLAAASLVALLEEKPLLAGVCAGLATITLSGGAALIVASLFTLVARRRLRSALAFTCAAMVFAAPWLGWSLAYGGVPVLNLHASELAVMLGNNAMSLAAAPFILLTGYENLYPGLLTAVALLIVLVRRRQFVPDLFVGLYCLLLLGRPEPPLRGFAPVLPLVLWILWRVARAGRFALVTKLAAALAIAPALWFAGAGLRPSAAPDDWRGMQALFAAIRDNTPPDAVLMADLDPVFYLNTGRATVRGFEPDSYSEYYGPRVSLVTPDQLRAAVLRNRVGYVALTPDRDLPESASFHRAVAAMERGGLLEPVSVAGASAAYRLLRVVR